MKKKLNRITWLDYGKGLTILLVVLGHVLLGLLESNKFTTHENLLLILVQMLYLFHIPVFFALSGFLFRPLNSISNYPNDVKNKLIILGMPYLFYNIMQFTLQSLGGSTVRNAASISDLLNIYKTPISVSWYLYVYFFILITVMLLSTFIKNKHILLAVSAVAFVVSMTLPIDVYIIQKLLLWTLFFVIGYYLNNERILKFIKENSKVVIAISLVLIVVFMFTWWNSNPEFYVSYDTPGLWGLIFLVSIPLAFALYPIFSKKKLWGGDYFTRYGKDSLIIYLLHAPIVSVTRIVLLKLGIDILLIHIVVGLAAGWFGSIIAIEIMKRVKYLDFVFYPAKYIKLKK